MRATSATHLKASRDRVSHVHFTACKRVRSVLVLQQLQAHTAQSHGPTGIRSLRLSFLIAGQHFDQATEIVAE